VRGRTAVRVVKDPASRQDFEFATGHRTAERRRPRPLRRIVDTILAFILLIIALPLLAASCIAVLVGSGRPVFFGHRRLGREGVPFRCWKLRTMYVGAEAALSSSRELRTRYVANGYKLSLGEDPRVTPVGRILRRTYLDELPQLFNVLNGTMSLVGPRPIVRQELTEYGAHADLLLSERPGIVGEWTSRGTARPGYPDRARMELDYIRTRSIATDIRILVRSLNVVLRGHQEPT
jgi:exopolysaccharide production protein ExoY